jgi:NAD-dependent SIR2 family protein deacetylase
MKFMEHGLTQGSFKYNLSNRCSNPVVQFSGKLRSDLFKWMEEWEAKADMCLCLGTSLSGMNADRMANTPAKRSRKDPKVLGTVIINLQQTPLDRKCAIRIWAKLDDAFKLLVNKLNLVVVPIIPTIPPGDVYVVPYNAKGEKVANDCRLFLTATLG